MEIGNKYFLYINIAIGIIYLLAIIIGYMKGFLNQTLKLLSKIVALVCAYLFADDLASLHPIVKLNDVYTLLGLDKTINYAVYFVLIFVVLTIIFAIVIALLKVVDKIPVLSTIDRLFGSVIGIINATLIVLLLSVLINKPFILNAEEVKENTVIKYVKNTSDLISNKINEFVVENNELLIDKDTILEIFNNEEINENTVIDKLKELNIEISSDKIQEIVDKLKKIVNDK